VKINQDSVKNFEVSTDQLWEQKVLDHPLDLDQDGRSWAMQAAYEGNTAKLIFLLNHGANPNFKSKDGLTPLMDAVMGSCADCIDLLIKAGSNVNEVNTRGESAIVMASTDGQVNAVKKLLKARADINITFNERGFTLLMDACFEGNLELIKILVEDDP
jgi:ankyrin repeat protein